MRSRCRRLIPCALALALLTVPIAHAAHAAPALLLEIHTAELFIPCGICPHPFHVFSAATLKNDGAFDTLWQDQNGSSPTLDPFFAMGRRAGVLPAATRQTVAAALAAAHAGVQGNCHIGLDYGNLLARHWLLTWHGKARTNTFVVSTNTESPFDGDPPLPDCPAAVSQLVSAIVAAHLVGH